MRDEVHREPVRDTFLFLSRKSRCIGSVRPLLRNLDPVVGRVADSSPSQKDDDRDRTKKLCTVSGFEIKD